MNSIQPQKRIIILDVLRGFAILGILIMNIQSFAMPSASYENPIIIEDFVGVDMLVWTACMVFANGKFMAIFSLLFGASVLLIIDNAKKKGRRYGELHYKRNFWLLVIGLFHAYVIWFGDILVSYALCAFILYLWRNASVKKLFISGICAFLVYTLLSILLHTLFLQMSEKDFAEAGLDNATVYQEQQMETRIWQQGTWQEQFALRAEYSLVMQTIMFVFYTLWYALGWMLIGMSVYKSGFLRGEKSRSCYLRFLVYGAFCGITIISFGIIRNLEQGFSLEYSKTIGTLWNFFGTIPLVFSYVALIILWCKSNVFSKFRKALACVGRMSLTNYLSQSLICSAIFYYFGMFGKLARWEQCIVVVSIWCVQIIFSQLWLQKFSFGPCERVWRYFTYDFRLIRRSKKVSL